MARIICGVDVSSISLEAFVAPKGATGSFHNTVEGIRALLEFCQQQQVELVAMEATGGYEKKAVQRRWAEGVGVAVLNPRGVREFAKCLGLLEKSDRPVCCCKKV